MSFHVDNESLTGGSSTKGSRVGSFIAGIRVADATGDSFRPLEATLEATITPLAATMSLVTMVVGAGVISLPAAVAKAGIFAGFGVVAFNGIIAIDSGRILCKAAEVAEELGHSISSFEDIGKAAMGKSGKGITIVMMQLQYFLLGCIYIFLAGQYLGMIVDTAAGKDNSHCQGVFSFLMNLNGVTFGGWMLVAGIALTPTLFMWNMGAVARLAPVGIGAAFVLIGCMIIGSFILVNQGGVDPNHRTILVPSIDSIISIFCKSIFSFCGVSMVPTMRREMTQPNKLTRCVVVAMTLVTLIYTLVCIPTTLAFGQPPDALLYNVNPVLLYMGAMGVVVHVFIALPLVLNVFFNTFARTILPVMETRSATSVFIRFTIVCCCLVIPMIFAKLSALLDLVSAITMLGTMILLPVFFNFQLMMKKTGSFGRAMKGIGYLSVIWQIVMCLIGIVAIVLGIKSGIEELTKANPCPLPKLVT